MEFIIGFLKNASLFIFFVILFFIIRYIYLWIKSLFKKKVN